MDKFSESGVTCVVRISLSMLLQEPLSDKRIEVLSKQKSDECRMALRDILEEYRQPE